MSKCLNTCSLKSQPWGYYFCIFPVSSDVFHLNGSSPHVMWWNWDCKRWEESDWCVHLYFVVSQLWEGFVWSWNHDSFPITLALKCFSVMLLSLRLTATVIPPSFSLFTLVTLDRAAYGQLKTKERMKFFFCTLKVSGVQKTIGPHWHWPFFKISLFHWKNKVYWLKSTQIISNLCNAS